MSKIMLDIINTSESSETMYTKITFGSNLFKSYNMSSSESSFSDGEFVVTLDDSTVNQKLSYNSYTSFQSNFSNWLEYSDEDLKSDKCSFIQDENHLKPFAGAESLEKEKSAVLGDISNKASLRNERKMLKAYTPPPHQKDRWQASVQGYICC